MEIQQRDRQRERVKMMSAKESKHIKQAGRTEMDNKEAESGKTRQKESGDEKREVEKQKESEERKTERERERMRERG